MDQVSAHVSRTALAGMQALWRQHAGGMDAQGKAFAQRVYAMHSEAIKVGGGNYSTEGMRDWGGTLPLCHLWHQARPLHPELPTLPCIPRQDVALMRTFELKPITALLTGFTTGVREAVLDAFQQVT